MYESSTTHGANGQTDTDIAARMAASISCFWFLFVAHDVYGSPSVKTKMSRITFVHFTTRLDICPSVVMLKAGISKHIPQATIKA